MDCMKHSLVEMLVCPRCLPEEIGLCLTTVEADDEEVIRGSLACPSCREIFPITEGTAVILPAGEPDDPSRTGYESSRALSAYLWSHYADIFGDAEACAAYRKWASLIPPTEGVFLDSGCAVGRFSFEMSQKSHFVIGIDNSKSFIHTARKLLKNRRIDFGLVLEGELRENRRFELPGAWNTNRVEFLVADAQALPFRSETFSCLSSLNLVDKVPRPLVHLLEIGRVARSSGSRLLFTDPFSWSTEAAAREHWLGGLPGGVFSGRGIDNVKSILKGERGGLRPPWTIEGQGSVWWKIRNHCNHFELIRSWYVTAVRPPIPLAPATG